jgi:GMP synthase (glutamine-hydrolysing)
LEQVHIHGVILSGGPSSVYDAESPHVHPEVWDMIEKKKIPVLGICYGMQELTFKFGGKVAPTPVREYGRAMVSVLSYLQKI